MLSVQPIDSRSDSVSYTHLDVYKRQQEGVPQVADQQDATAHGHARHQQELSLIHISAQALWMSDGLGRRVRKKRWLPKQKLRKNSTIMQMCIRDRTMGISFGTFIGRILRQ